jgi:hypothetical protein
MKIRIEDTAALATLSWVDLKAYLDAENWQRNGTYAGKAAIYHKTDGGGQTSEVLVPLRDDLADYAASMGRALATLARVEGRDEDVVFADLSAAGADVVRLRAPQADAEGTIALSHGVAIYREAENLMLAAACAAREPRRSYHARKIAEVRDFLDGVRLGQTERGSYVVTIRSPIAPALRRSEPRLSLFDLGLTDEPFPRAVTLKLAEALESVRGAVSQAIDNDRFDAFEAAVPRGVNANFCDALAQLSEHGAGLEVSIAWARVRPTAGPARQFRFSRDIARVLQEAAVEFRKNEPKLDENVEGFVIHLDRPPERFDGHATLRVLLDGRPRRVRVTFEPHEYTQVLRAHDERVLVSLDGDIYPVGHRFELRNPRNLRLLTEPADPDDGASAGG